MCGDSVPLRVHYHVVNNILNDIKFLCNMHKIKARIRSELLVIYNNSIYLRKVFLTTIF